jgi:hypothetical protein
MRSARRWASSGRRSDDAVAVSVAVKRPVCTKRPGHFRWSVVVVRGRIELPTFRFSGLSITVQDRPRWSLCLPNGLRCTPMDAGVRGCMRLEMRLLAPAGDPWLHNKPGLAGTVAHLGLRPQRDRLGSGPCRILCSSLVVRAGQLHGAPTTPRRGPPRSQWPSRLSAAGTG